LIIKIDIPYETVMKNLDLLTQAEKKVICIVFGINRDKITDVEKISDEAGLPLYTTENLLSSAISKLKRVQD